MTQEVLWLSRWQAADLYLRDIENLRWELSVQSCSDELTQALGYEHPEPYREYLRDTRERLKSHPSIGWGNALHGMDSG